MHFWGFRLGTTDVEIRDQFFRGGERTSGTDANSRRGWEPRRVALWPMWGYKPGGHRVIWKLVANTGSGSACSWPSSLPLWWGLMPGPDEGKGTRGHGARRSAGPHAKRGKADLTALGEESGGTGRDACSMLRKGQRKP